MSIDTAPPHPPSKEPELSSPLRWDEEWLEWESRERGQRAEDWAGPGSEEITFLVLAPVAV